MAPTPEQRRILNKIVSIGHQVGATPKEVKAAVETGLVESNLSNPSGGDADSAGWRQERASLYSNPTNVDASIRRFFKETAAVRDQHGSSGSLAAAVQRPAAQYRGRYAQVAGQAAGLLGGTSSRTGSASQSRGASSSVTTTTPGVDNAAARQQLVLSFLNSSGTDPVSFASQFKALADVPGTSSTVTTPGAGGGATSPSVGGGGLANVAKQRADVINAQALPYKWGGGHAGKTKIADPIPLDCSGAVSKVLGIDPRVASDFKTWGRPGDGGDKGVTIAANDEHVLMKIRGHWFGTSASNPSGGAGWIPEEQITPAYLSRFTMRHSAR